MANHIKVTPIYPHEEAAVRAAFGDGPEYLITFALFGLARPEGYDGMPDAPGLDADPNGWSVYATAVARKVSEKRLHPMPEIERAVEFARVGKSPEELQQEQMAALSRQVKLLRSSDMFSEDQIQKMVGSFMISSTAPEPGDGSPTTSE